MAFHRLVAPAYFSPPSFDYMNNGGTGTPAFVDAPRIAGPNAGTRFIGFGEDGLSGAFNRGLHALSENTDQLDDWFHRDIATPARTGDVVAVGPVSSITITGPNIFLGAAGTPSTPAGFSTFLQVLDDSDKEIVDTSLVRCEITAVTGGTVGSGGFSSGDVTLTITPAIPDGVAYRVYYGVRSNLSTLPVDALTSIKIRSAQEVSALLEAAGGANLIGYNGGASWRDGTTNPGPTSVGAQLDKMLSELVADAGADRIGSAAAAGSPYALTSGSIADALTYLLASLNTAQNQLTALIGDLYRVRTLTTAATINSPSRDALIVLNPAATFALTLPSPATCTGQHIRLVNGDGTMAAGNKVTLTRSGGELLNGVAANVDLVTPHGHWLLSSDGTNWHLS